MSSPVPSSAVLPEKPERPLTVLLVDDQEVVGEAVRRMLSDQADIRFHHCLDPSAAVRAALDLRPTVILQDVVMPDVDGLTLVRFYRRLPELRETPVIMLSGREDAQVKAEAFAVGASDYVVKLPDQIELLARIRYHSRGYIATLERNQAFEQLRASEQRLRDHERHLLELTTTISRELHLIPLLEHIIRSVNMILDSERSTIFMWDRKTDELWSLAGASGEEIRFPADRGLAGECFRSGQPLNIPDAYADSRFNRAVDHSTGFRTRSILCVPVINKQGKTTAVLQALNKREASFTDYDIERLQALSAQISIALENAQLFDEVLRVKNYNESILRSMSNGVLTLDADGRVITINEAARRILRLADDALLGVNAAAFLLGDNQWLAASIEKVLTSGVTEIAMDAELHLPWAAAEPSGSDAPTASLNLSVAPLTDGKKRGIGCVLMLEDMTTEKRLKGTMARYMPKDVADRLLEGGEAALGGQLLEATVLFTDIRGFTTISEVIGPQETVSMLNAYFSRMVDSVMEAGGVLDKFIGDAIMAVFGVPIGTEQDCDNALSAALDMLRQLRDFNLTRHAEPIRMGVGIHTDMVVSGNIGSLKRMDYTVIGDGVNLASRLEGANKHFGTAILISEPTRSRLKKTYRLREVDQLRVKGKASPVGVYEAMDHYLDDEFPHLDRVLEIHRQAMELYRQRQWDEAGARFEQACALAPEDGLTRLYVGRCKHFRREPPEPGWDGVWSMKDK